MQIWVPRWSITPPAPGAAPASWFGGLPTGLPADRWPVCGECDAPLTPLLQIAAGPWVPRIPADHVLLVFTCEGPDVCSFWDPDEIANRCMIVARDELTDSGPPPASVTDGRTRILPRLWVREWVPSEDGVTPEQALAVDDRAQFWDLPEEISLPHGFDSAWLTKAGGAPYWTANGPSPEPPHPRQLLLQIDTWLAVVEPPQDVADYLGDADTFVEVSGSTIGAANFCSDGIGYVFDITPDAETPTLRFVICR